MPEDVDLQPDPETPSGDGVSEDLPETPFGEDGSAGEAEAEPAGDDADASTDDPTDPDDALPDDEQGLKAWQNLEKKFSHIADPEARQRAVAKAYWSKANYASQTRRENEELKARVARLEKEKPPEPEAKDIPPHPDIAKIDAKIQTLYTKTQTIQADQKGRLEQLKIIDREVAIAEDRLKDAYDEQKPAWQQKLELAQQKYDGVRQQYLYGNERLEELNGKLEQEIGNRDWVEKFHKEERARHTREQSEKEQEFREFPARVDGYITEIADEAGIPKDERVRQSCWRHVNRAIMVELRRLDVSDVDKVDVRDLVDRYVREYAEDRDIQVRSKFTERSREKLRVATATVPGRAPAPASRAPVSTRAPVPVSLLSSDASPAMARARQILVKRLGGGR
jgi:hypothetical protein